MLWRIISLVVGVGAFFALPAVLAEFQLFQVCLIAATALAVLGLVIVTGLAGQISLAQAAFVGLGGYIPAIIYTQFGVPIWAGIPLAAIVIAAVGFLLGQLTLRVSGHYLALATMAFTAIVQLAFIHWESVTGGAVGLAMPTLELFGISYTSGRGLYYIVVPVTALLFCIVYNFLASPVGRTFAAIRQSETAAEAMGINVLAYKAAAFAASGFLGAIGGALLALLSTYLDPSQFGITQTVYFLAVAVVGGMLSPIGALIGSAVFIILPEFLQTFQTYLGLVFALLLLGFIVLRPNGLVSMLATLRRIVPSRARGAR
ncbi:leucine/isoleucine/valine transporter permease subunit [Variibacter gotjawalensis]|uniref:Leucine/isoleucine/valine transporter permease subunit n=1 Tax=Variibacter gotjawalensis TaxID=1333996 RepID=A0A0S3PU85_9BRAD|nr:branched-chain amino acid ABC transporter permease [Variibacter gotjawalensis]NIK49774.1 branched-chain amino acid transport system permease protein [Variibacter gotjawalensis]RZS45779.1 amino acid/amide ABC transporter membrane protein 2 (HAAT family) [Variibacter gotjawalensis]BAT59452.1 leucine/isoleucine/valine transporter permease subunit [Variibacter gotjawalensis]